MKSHTVGRIISAIVLAIALGVCVLALVITANSSSNQGNSSTAQNSVESGTFYLDLLPGCYSIDESTSPTVPIATVGIQGGVKTFYSRGCSQPHHIEVIYSGPVETADGSTTPSGNDMIKECSIHYQEAFGRTPPTTASGTSAWYLNSFSADPGAEAEQYLNKGVCVVFQTEATFKNYVVVTNPAI